MSSEIENRGLRKHWLKGVAIGVGASAVALAGIAGSIYKNSEEYKTPDVSKSTALSYPETTLTPHNFQRNPPTSIDVSTKEGRDEFCDRKGSEVYIGKATAFSVESGESRFVVRIGTEDMPKDTAFVQKVESVGHDKNDNGTIVWSNGDTKELPVCGNGMKVPVRRNGEFFVKVLSRR